MSALAEACAVASATVIIASLIIGGASLLYVFNLSTERR